MTNAELQALELQARIMGWAPATTWDSIVDVRHTVLYTGSRHPITFDWSLKQYRAADGLDHSEY